MTAPPPDPAAVPATEGAPWMNPANLLTVVRLLLVPVVALLIFAHGGHDAAWRGAACGAFFVASVTDRLDGEIARRYGLVTSFGKMADPIADKALTGTTLVSLSLLGDLPSWVTAVILIR
ncbi:MAG: CDP-alcohol phosphatidyltransferase family protein, partial [Mycobacteriales bacterium]